MGHQKNFYLSRADLSLFLKEVCQRERVSFLPSTSREPKPQVLPRDWFTDISFAELKLFMVQDEHLHAMVWKEATTTRYVDVQKSLAIELWRSYEDEKVLRRGRLYYIDKYRGAKGELIVKPPSFIAWAKSVFRLLSKMFPGKHDGTFLIGPDAQAKAKSGVELPAF